MSGTILIYGATGYTGKLIAKAAADAGARPILAGRPPAWRRGLPSRAPLALARASASLVRTEIIARSFSASAA